MSTKKVTIVADGKAELGVVLDDTTAMLVVVAFVVDVDVIEDDTFAATDVDVDLEAIGTEAGSRISMGEAIAAGRRRTRAGRTEINLENIFAVLDIDCVWKGGASQYDL